MGFPAEVYAARRREFMDRIGPQSVAVFPAAPVAVRSNDVDYTYRADNDLLYLTGFAEPESVCLMLPGHAKEEVVLFVLPKDPERETWTGRRAGVEGARDSYGAVTAYPIDELSAKIGELASDRQRLYYRFGRDDDFNERVITWMRQWQTLRPRSGKGPVSIVDPGEILHEMRLFKTSAEIDLMRRAVAISAEAHVAAMRAARPGCAEFEIESLLDSTFRRMGGGGPAYPSIVAAGVNATILHYTNNDCTLRDGDLLLIDAGAEFQHYCSDVTRTFPVSGRFSPAQRALYEVVLEAQLKAIEVIAPGVPYDEPHKRAVEVLVDGLLRLGLLTGDRDQIIAKEEYKPYYMHRTSHWLGMDVHDVGQYKLGDAVRTLAPGMVLTVEPGLYVKPDAPCAPPEFRGIGIRIEDDVLVTKDGHDVLSGDIPKATDEVERLCAA
jgi:Xaa-Pro aminopeptidase